MKTPEWLKPGILGAAAGAVAVAVLGFTWGGWVTGGTAKAMASDRARLEVVDALVPFCIARSEQDPDATTRLSEIAAARSYQRADLLMKAGWATPPGADTADRDLAKACAERLSASS